MTINIEEAKRIPGTYVRARPNATELANIFFREWEDRRKEGSETPMRQVFPPTICVSRQIGACAAEVAEIVARRIGFRVADKEIIEYIANEGKLSEKTVSYFDQRYPGKLAELLSMAFGEKAFIKSDYTRLLFSAVLSIGGLGGTIFVGRGAHLVLPRERVLAVRFIASWEQRVKRLAGMLGMTEKEAEVSLDESDTDRRNFYISVYGKKDASPYEFDLVINCDHACDPSVYAEIVEKAFKGRFGQEL
jgi:hypothetical protein